MTKQLRILIADDHPLLREGIAHLLRGAGYEVVGAVSNAADLMSELERVPVDVVSLDIGMPGINGLEAARQIRSRLPRVRIVILTQQTDVAYLRVALRSGAQGFVSKQCAAKELLSAVQTVTMGRIFISPSLLERQPAPLRLKDLMSDRDDVLTGRQSSVLQLIAEGKSIKEIAALMGISPKTVEFHKRAIVDALGIATTAELTKYAVIHGLSALDR
jgi:DNA-binding NarL/FixJ family response regulator